MSERKWCTALVANHVTNTMSVKHNSYIPLENTSTNLLWNASKEQMELQSTSALQNTRLIGEAEYFWNQTRTGGKKNKRIAFYRLSQSWERYNIKVNYEPWKRTGNFRLLERIQPRNPKNIFKENSRKTCTKKKCMTVMYLHRCYKFDKSLLIKQT